MTSPAIRTSYLSVLRAIRQTCRNDVSAASQIAQAVKDSVRQLVHAKVPDSEIVNELDLTRQMISVNMTQASYNPELDSYAVRLTEEMVPQDGVTVDIKTAQDVLDEQNVNLDELVSRHSK